MQAERQAQLQNLAAWLKVRTYSRRARSALRSVLWPACCPLLCPPPFVQANHPADVLMPVAKGGKAPLLCHRGGSWTWAQYDALDKSKDVDYAIILQELAVIDVDSEEQARLLAERFPALRVAPRESTRRGMHFFFARSSACAALRGAASETRGRGSGERRVRARVRARARRALLRPARRDRPLRRRGLLRRRGAGRARH